MMKDAVKAIGGLGIVVALLLASVLVAALLIQGGVWLSAVLYPWLLGISGITLAVTVFVLLPNAFFSSVPGFAGTGMVVASYVFGATLWVCSLLLTYTLWGGLGLWIGLFMAGLGVVPLAILATLLHAMWSQVGQLMLLLALTLGVRGWGYRLLRQAEQNRLLRAGAGGESRSHEEVRRQLEAAQALTSAYTKVLQTPRGHFWPLSMLPASKETMKMALKMDAAYQASQGVLDKPLEGGKASLRDTYSITYASLADFVPDDLAARINPFWEFIESASKFDETGGKLTDSALADALGRLDLSEEEKQASQNALEEFAELASEMRAYLDRVARGS